MAVRDLSLLTTASRRNLNSADLLWSNLIYILMLRQKLLRLFTGVLCTFFT